MSPQSSIVLSSAYLLVRVELIEIDTGIDWLEGIVLELMLTHGLRPLCVALPLAKYNESIYRIPPAGKRSMEPTTVVPIMKMSVSSQLDH